MDLIVDDTKQVVALEPAAYLVLLGQSGERIVVVYKEKCDGWLFELIQSAAQLAHIDRSGGGLGLGDSGFGAEPPRAAGRHGEAAAAHAEFAGHCGQSHDRRRGATAVAIAFLAPSTANRRRARFGVQTRKALEVRSRNPGYLGGALERPGLGALSHLLGADGVPGQKLSIGGIIGKEPADQGQSHGQIGARKHGNMQVGRAGQRDRPGIDDH